MPDMDHDILMKQQIKLDQICSSITDLKTESKDLRNSVEDGFKKLTAKLATEAIGCVQNRAICQKENNSKFVTTRMVLFALTVNTTLLTAIGLVLKWTGVI